MYREPYRRPTADYFRSYSLEEFVNDNSFQRICRRKDALKIIKYLKNELPEKSRDIDLAYNILTGLYLPEFKQSTARKELTWNEIIDKDRKQKRLVFFRYAASILALIGITVFILSVLSKSHTEYYLASDETVSDYVMLILSNGKKIDLGQGNTTIKYDRESNSIIIDDTINLHHYNTYEGNNQVVIPYGQRSKILLSDGTTVWLNSGSKLTYNPSFKGKKREVILDGEGYFDVSENSKKPFIVHTDSAAIQVLGTKFNIKSYKRDNEFCTSLLEGSISIKLNGREMTNEIILKPNQQASLNRDGISIISVENIENCIAWIDGYLILKNENMGNILEWISHYYNINIILKYKRKINNIHGKLDLKEQPETVMEILALISGTKYSFDGNSYLFSD